MLIYPPKLIEKRTKQIKTIILLVILELILYLTILIMGLIWIRELSKFFFVLSLSILTFIASFTILFNIETVINIKRVNCLFLGLNERFEKKNGIITSIDKKTTTINKIRFFDCLITIDNQNYHYYLYSGFNGEISLNKTYQLLVSDYYLVGVENV